jgi:hypothetical protein
MRRHLVFHRPVSLIPLQNFHSCALSSEPSIYLWLYSPLLVLICFSVSWSFTQTVCLLRRGLSPSQGRYLHTEQHRQPRLEWDSNPQSQRSSGRIQYGCSGLAESSVEGSCEPGNESKIWGSY